MSSVYTQDDASVRLSLPRTTTVAFRLPWGSEGRILMSWPEAAPRDGGHPLLVLLGGEHLFGLARDLARLVAQDAAPTEPGIVAAVVLDDEEGFDLPWTAPGELPNGAAVAAAIASAIDGEIAALVPVDRSRIGAVGFDASARFAVEILLTAPETFAVTVAANPAVWQGGLPPIDANALRERLAALPPRELLLLTGGEGAGSARAKRSRMAANARTIATRLTEARVDGLSVTLSIIDEDDPVALVPAAIGRALRLAFAPRPAPAAEAPS
ncbi:MAG: hypothetical protein ACWA6X_01220 [Bauldia sp.]